MSNQTTNSATVDQVELACRLIDDDESALADILTHFGGAILRLLVAKYPRFNSHDAEDVLSIATRKLWDRRQQYDESQGSLRAYLFKIADNTAKDIFKCGWSKAKNLPADIGDNNQVDLIPEPVPPKDESKRQRKDREKRHQKELGDLRSVIDNLPEKQRRIIISDVHARNRISDSAKLSDELGIPVATVRVYRHRAWKTIREKMTQLGYELPPEGEIDGK